MDQDFGFDPDIIQNAIGKSTQNFNTALIGMAALIFGAWLVTRINK